jgi:uncharacterized protein (DUF305 family)
MSTFRKVIAAAILLLLPGIALAQNETHHPADAPAQAQTMSPEMMQSMMQMMQNCMGMMQMMQGSMQSMPMQGGMNQDMPMQGNMSEATAAYMAAMSKMNAPMMQGIQSGDPDIAFVKGMIPHHQSAIDMANAALQYGKDAQVKAWAEQIIAAQEKEIAEMQEWLKAHGQ